MTALHQTIQALMPTGLRDVGRWERFSSQLAALHAYFVASGDEVSARLCEDFLAHAGERISEMQSSRMIASIFLQRQAI